MNQAVCKSSPIIALSSIKRIEILSELFQLVYIPQAVYAEVTRTESNLTGHEELQSMLKTDRFRVYEIRNRNTEAVQQMYGKLHFGEIEVVMADKELSITNVILF
jgi:predicted nucleic acid-binding protein